MLTNSRINRLPILILAAALIATTIGWQTSPTQSRNLSRDTVPVRNKKIRNIDDALEQLEKGKIEADRSLKDIDWDKMNIDIQESLKNVHINEAEIKAQVAEAMKQVDAVKIQANVQKAMNELDIEKIKAQVQKELKDIDAVKIQADVNESMKEIDAEKIKAEVAAELKDIDVQKIQAEVQASIAKIDMAKIKEEMDEVKHIDLENIKIDMKNLKPEIEKSLKEAHVSIDNAKKELTGYKLLIDGLDKDGFINKNNPYTIEYKNGDLLVNGKKQADEVVKKYQDVLKGHKDFTITSNKDDFNINTKD